MKNLRGFSLMEMMVVLLIVSIVAAASAPMINKKLVGVASDKSPWVWVGNSDSIAYNLNGAKAQSAMVGSLNIPAAAGNARFYIDTRTDGANVVPQMAFGTTSVANSSGVTKLASAFNTLWLSTETPRFNVASNNSVLLGSRSTANGYNFSNTVIVGANSRLTGATSQTVGVGADMQLKGTRATAIGYGSKAEAENTVAIVGQAVSTNSVAIGAQSKAKEANAVAIGSQSVAQTADSVAIGAKSNAYGNNSVAIGIGANAKQNDGLAIGTRAQSVGVNAVAIGNSAYAQGANSFAVGGTRGGGSSYSGGTNAIRIGYNIRGGGEESIAIGGNSSSHYTDAIAIGRSANADWHGAVSIGAESNAWWDNCVAIGNEANAYTYYSVAIGGNSNCYGGHGAVAIGSNAQAKYNSSVAIGNNAEAKTSDQIVLGTSSSTVYIPGKLVVGTPRGIYLKTDDGSWKWKNSWVRIYGVTKTYDADRYVAGVEQSTPNLSDRRLKTVGKAFIGGLNEIKKLEVFNYTFKSDKSKTPRVGVMAQDLQKIFPNAVVKGDDGFLRIRMEDMFYAIVNAIKELDAKIETLKAQEVAVLKDKVTKLEKENKALERRIADLEKKIK